MSALGDAFAALKNVLLVQERLDAVRNDVERLAADVRDLNTYAVSLDKRIVRIETLVEFGSGRGSDQRRIES